MEGYTILDHCRILPCTPSMSLLPQVEKQEASAQEKAAATKAIADSAQKDLDEALPALEVAVACLKDLKKSDIDEVTMHKVCMWGYLRFDLCFVDVRYNHVSSLALLLVAAR